MGCSNTHGPMVIIVAMILQHSSKAFVVGQISPNFAHAVETIGRLQQSSRVINSEANDKLRSTRQAREQLLRHMVDGYELNAGLWYDIIAEPGNGTNDLKGRNLDISVPCRQSLYEVLGSIKRGEMWALNMFDSSGKLPSGFLLGNLLWRGHYGQCLDSSSRPATAADNVTINAQYCSVRIGSTTKNHSSYEPMDIVITLGLCVPNTCSSQDAMDLMNAFLVLIPNIGSLDATCLDKEQPPMNAGIIVVICILSILGVVILIATAYDVIVRFIYPTGLNGCLTQATRRHDIGPDNDDDSLTDGQAIGDDDDALLLITTQPAANATSGGSIHKILISFSIYTNVGKILTVDEQPEGTLRAVHGIRFLSMTWIILGHTYTSCIQLAENIGVTLSLVQRFSFQAVVNATVSVDTFFLLSGTLVSYLLLRELKRVGGSLRKINWFKFYFHRFWRLTPALMLVIAVYTTLIRYAGSGPSWPYHYEEYCERNWWTNLLYINNIVKLDDQCLGWSWYLANDMQFYLISPLLIILFFKSAMIGTAATVLLIAVSCVSLGVITYVNHFPAEMVEAIFNTDKLTAWMNATYYAPWCRFGPYGVGIILGYILHRAEGKARMHWIWVTLGWCVAATCSLSVLYGLYNVANGHPLNPSVGALYAGVHRTVWSVGVAWVIYACANGLGGFVDTILSWSPFVALSRLTYCTYLVHLIVLMWIYGNRQTTFFLDDITMASQIVGNIVLSYIAAFVTSLAFEAPMINLERAFLRNTQ